MRRIIGVLIGSLFLTSPAFADGHTFGARVGMLGLGIEYSYGLTDKIAIRGALNGSSYSFDATESSIDYEFDLDFDSLSVGLDVHPTTGPFRISFGLLQNDNSLSAASLATQDITIGNTTYPAAEVGTLRGRVGFDSTAPYVGLGWDWSRSKKIGVSLDFGVVSQGTPIVALSADGPIAGDPDFLAELVREEAELQSSLDDFDLFPYVSLGVSFKF